MDEFRRDVWLGTRSRGANALIIKEGGFAETLNPYFHSVRTRLQDYNARSTSALWSRLVMLFCPTVYM